MRANKNKKFETLEAEWDFLNGGGGVLVNSSNMYSMTPEGFALPVLSSALLTYCV